MQSVTSKSLCALGATYTSRLLHLSQSHELKLIQLEMESESALADETRATQSALDALKRNHEESLRRGIQEFKKSFIHKYEKIIKPESHSSQQESSLSSLSDQIREITLKYNQKSIQVTQLQEKLLSK